MKLKKHVVLATLVAAGLGLSTASTAVSAQTLKLAHAMTTDHPVALSLNWFAKEVSKRTHNRVKVYPNATLGKEATTLQMAQNGTIAFTKVAGGLLASFSDDYKLLSLPYLYNNEAESKRILRGPIGQEILASSEKDGFVGLAFLSSGSRGFYSQRKIEKTTDLKGLKVRVQNSPVDIDTMKALGASPVPIAYSEIYSALQQGVADAAENNIPSYFSSRHFEVAKYFTLDAHTMIPDILVVSSEVWHSLSKEDQATIRQVAKETVQQQDHNWDSYMAKAKTQLESKGVTFVHVDTASFQDAVKPVYTKFKQDNPQLVPLLDRIQKEEQQQAKKS